MSPPDPIHMVSLFKGSFRPLFHEGFMASVCEPGRLIMISMVPCLVCFQKLSACCTLLSWLYLKNGVACNGDSASLHLLLVDLSWDYFCLLLTGQQQLASRYCTSYQRAYYVFLAQ